MSYLDESRLSTYDSNLKEWISSQESKTLTSSIYSWTKTAKAGAVSCYPVSGTELKPVVDFLFTETPPASGDKSPENPSTISGVSEVNLWLAGKNVNRTMPYYGFTDGVKVYREVTFTANQDGSVTANGTATGGDAICTLLNTNNVTNYETSIGIGTWRLSGCPSGGSNSTYAVQPILSAGCGSISYDYGSGGSIVVTKPGAGVGIILRVASGYNAQNLVFRPQIELGTTATSYEQPVEKQKFTFPLGSTYYGGTLDVASGVMTVTHTTVVVNGNTTYSASIGKTETATSYSLAFYPPVSRSKYQGITDKACNLFSTDGSTNCVAFGNNSYNIRIILEKSLLGLADDLSFYELQPAFQSFFGEHPMTIVYRLETPYTVQLDPVFISALAQPDKYTPRLNTIYTDASSVQVGYVKSPIREEFELQQAIVSQGGEI